MMSHQRLKKRYRSVTRPRMVADLVENTKNYNRGLGGWVLCVGLGGWLGRVLCVVGFGRVLGRLLRVVLGGWVGY